MKRNTETPIPKSRQDASLNHYMERGKRTQCVWCSDMVVPKCENDKKRERGKQWAWEAALIFPDKVTQIHGDNVIGLDLVEYVTARIPVKFMCLRKPEHGVWQTSPDSVLGGSGCSKCSASRGEREITKFLSDQGIIFEHQKILFEVYRYDFYLPELNVLIEYDGEQHFSPQSALGPKSLRPQRPFLIMSDCQTRSRPSGLLITAMNSTG